MNVCVAVFREKKRVHYTPKIAYRHMGVIACIHILNEVKYLFLYKSLAWGTYEEDPVTRMRIKAFESVFLLILKCLKLSYSHPTRY